MKRRSGIKVMGQLIGLVVPLLHVMLTAIFLGVAGFLCAIFLTILAGTALMYFDTPAIVSIHIKISIAFAVLRGILHYAEQACNHYILLLNYWQLSVIRCLSLLGSCVRQN